MTNLVGNLSYQTTDCELATTFGEFDPVERASVIRDRDSGLSRGFGSWRRAVRQMQTAPGTPSTARL